MTDEQQKGLDSTPVQDITDSKDEAEKSFLKELDEAEKAPATAAAPSAEPPKAPKDDKSKSRFSAAMDALKSKPKRKHSIDPILGVSLVVLTLACVVVLGNAAYAEFIDKSGGSTVETGDTVNVRYTGAFYNYFGQDGAIVFDTNVEDVGDYLKETQHTGEHSWAYTHKTTYSDLSFTVGGTTVLKKFGSATIGHKVGDKIQVEIGADDGYELPDTSKGSLENGFTMESNTLTMTSSEFSALYGFTAPTAFVQPVKFSDHPELCPFGCDYEVATVDGKVVVTNNFNHTNNEYNMFGEANAKVKIVLDGGKYKVTYKDLVSVPSSGKMTKLAVFHDNAWVLGYAYNDGNTLMYKTGETLGAKLFFTIEITSIKKA